MLKAETIVNEVTGKAIVEKLIDVLSENLQDFSKARERYLKIISVLQTEIGTSTSPAAQEDSAAIEKQTLSNLLFSAYLGIKANLDNYINPIAQNFLEVDSDVYLRESLAHRLPEYKKAQNIRNRFYEQLSPIQKRAYEDVIVYTSYLESAGPKIAHYYGYVLGNELLPWIIPGYYVDAVQTAQYTARIKAYFDVQQIE